MKHDPCAYLLGAYLDDQWESVNPDRIERVVLTIGFVEPLHHRTYAFYRSGNSTLLCASDHTGIVLDSTYRVLSRREDWLDARLTAYTDILAHMREGTSLERFTIPPSILGT